METSRQPFKSVATKRPTDETRKSWLNLLNFMRFLHFGSSVRAQRKLVRLPHDHCKSPAWGAASYYGRGEYGIVPGPAGVLPCGLCPCRLPLQSSALVTPGDHLAAGVLCG